MSWAFQPLLPAAAARGTINASITESVTTTESQTNLLTANAYVYELDETPFITEPYVMNGTASVISSPSNASTYGLRFVSNYTGQIGIVGIRMFRSSAGKPLPSQQGSIRIFNLTSVTSTTLGSLVAELNFDLSTIDADSVSFKPFDFTNVSGASLVNGNAYAVVVVGGSDWNVSSTEFLLFMWNHTSTSTLADTVQNKIVYPLIFNTGTTITSGASGNSTIFHLSISIQQANSGVLENSAGSAIFSTALTETQTSTVSESSLLTTSASSVETTTSAESGSGDIQLNRDLTETGTITETQTQLLTSNAYTYELDETPFITEPYVMNGTSSVISSPSNASTYGLRFVSNYTGQIGIVGIRMYKAITANPLPSQQASIKIFNLTSVTSTTLGSLVAQLNFDLSTIDDNNTFKPFDFTNVSGASLVNGNAYAVVVVGGSDWSTSSTQYLLFTWNNTTTSSLVNTVTNKIVYPLIFNTGTTITSGASGYSLNTSNSFHLSISIQQANSGVLENSAGSAIFPIALTETAAASTSENLQLNTYVYPYEASTNLIAAEGYSSIAQSLLDTSTTFDISNGNAVGIRFIASTTGRLGKVIADISSTTLSSSSQVSIQLWSLDSNSLTANRQTLVASATIPVGQLYTAGAIKKLLLTDFSNDTSANVTAGTAYSVIVTFPLPGLSLSFYAPVVVPSILDTYRSEVNNSSLLTTRLIQMAVEYQSTNVDSAQGIFIINADETETGATTESATSDRQANTWITDDAFVGLVLPNSGSFTGYGLSFGDGYGTRFIANKTGRIGYVIVRNVLASVGTPSTTGTIELWSLSGNTIDGTPSSLITSAILNYSEFPATGITTTRISFKSAAADVTQNNAYAVVLKAGTDWTTGIMPSLLQNAIPTNADNYNNTLSNIKGIKYSGSTTNWIVNFAVPYIPFILPVNDESVSSSLITTVALTETGAASESPISDLAIYKGNYEASSGTRAADGYTTIKTGTTFSTLTIGNSYRVGMHFIAPSTGRLGKIAVEWGSNPTANGDPIAIELWSLASNSVTASRQTLITQYNTTTTVIASSAANTYKIIADFSDNSSADVTAGNGYAVVVYQQSTNYNDIKGYTAQNNGDYLTQYRTTYGTGTIDTLYALKMGIEYQSTNIDSAQSIFIINADETETSTTADSLTGTLTAFGPTFEAGSGVPALNTLSYPYDYTTSSSIANAGGGSLNNATGLNFIANRTGQLGKIVIPLSRQTGSTTVTQLGNIELWQLASNSVSALPSTLIASIPFSLYSLSTTVGAQATFDFSSVSGATVTTGVGYAIVATAGSDWSNGTTDFASIRLRGWFTNGNTSVYTFSRVVERTYASNTWSQTPIRFIQASVEYQNTTADVLIGGFIAASALTESNTSASSEDSTIIADTSLTETVTSSDSTLNDTAFAPVILENLSSSETQTQLLTANAFIYELDETPFIIEPYVINGNTTNIITIQFGLRFISNYTGQLGITKIRIFRGGTGNPLPSQQGSIRIFNLTSVTSTTLGSLVAQLDFDLSSIDTDSVSFKPFDFTNVSGASLVNGNAYAIFVVGGSDWTSSTQYLRFSWDNAADASLGNIVRNKILYPFSISGASSVVPGAIGTVQNALMGISIQQANSGVLDSFLGQLSVASNLTESNTSASSEDSTIIADTSLIETALRTNYVRNNTMVGAVTGTPGTFPNTWSLSTFMLSTYGLSSEVVSTGVENSINYIDLRFYTATTTLTSAGDQILLSFDSTPATATIDQTWTASTYCKLIAGNFNNITSLRLRNAGRNSGGSSVEVTETSITTSNSTSLDKQRFTATRTYNNALTVGAGIGIYISFSGGVAIDFTVRFGMPQMELNSVATEVIPTSGTIASAGPSSKESNVTAFAPVITEKLRKNLLQDSSNYERSSWSGTATVLSNKIRFSETFDDAYWGKVNSDIQTNLLKYSEDFSNIAWNKGNCILSYDVAVAPDDTTTADYLQNTVSVNSGMSQSITFVDSVYTRSIFVKPDGSGNSNIFFEGVGGSGLSGQQGGFLGFNTVTKIFSGNTSYPISYGYIDYPNGWMKVYVTAQHKTDLSQKVNSSIYIGAYGNTAVQHGVYIWGYSMYKGYDYNAPYQKTTNSALPIKYNSPNNNINAYKLLERDTASSVIKELSGTFSATSGIKYTFSIYAKAAERSVIRLQHYNSFFASSGKIFYDLSAGTIISTGANVTGTISSAGEGWYRISITGTCTSTGTSTVYASICSGPSTDTYIGSSQYGILLYGAQVTAGQDAGDYVVTGGGGTETAIAYLDSNGTRNARKLVETSSVNNNQRRLQGSIATVPDKIYTASVYVKAAERSKGMLKFSKASAPYEVIYCNFDLVAKTVGYGASNSAPSTGLNGSITELANGWFRITVSGSLGSSNLSTAGFSIGMYDTTESYVGDDTSGIYFWGAQFEEAAAATTLSDTDLFGEVANLVTNTNIKEYYTPTEVNAASSLLVGALTESQTNTSTETGALLVNRSLTESALRTNYVSNNTMVGAVAGTPGTLPTEWGYILGTTALSTEIVGFSQSGSSSYIDIRISGTPAATAEPRIVFQGGTNPVPASEGQVWTLAFQVAMTAGSTTNLGTVRARITQRTTGGTLLGSILGSSVTGSLSSTPVTATATGTASSVGVQRIDPEIGLNVTLNQPIDITLRLSLMQLELGSVATEVISTSGSFGTAGPSAIQSNLVSFVSSINEAAQRTNLLRNSTMQGAAVGVFPTNWTTYATGANGYNVSVVGTGTEDGYNYTDFRFFGTNNEAGTAYPEIVLTSPESTGPIAAQGETFTASAYLKIVSGGNQNINVSVRENTSSGSYLGNSPANIVVQQGQTKFATVTRTMVSASTGRTGFYIFRTTAPAESYDFVLRVYAPQLERSPVATEYIPTSGTAVSAGPGSRQSNTIITNQQLAETLTADTIDSGGFITPVELIETGTPAESSNSDKTINRDITELNIRTNYIRNNTMVGALAGTPGTLPTNWNGSGTIGTLVREIIGTGTSGGINYVDIRFSGTTSSANNTGVYFEDNATVAASVGQTWTSSVYASIVGGSTTNLSSVSMSLVERGSGGTGLIFTGQNITISNSLQRFNYTRTFTDVNVVAAQPGISINFASGVAIDITLRIGLPQLELGSVATEVISTSGSFGTAGPSAIESNITSFSSSITESSLRTNLVPNSTMVGAAVGVNPNLWWPSGFGGGTTSVVGTGTENGYPYVDYRIVGTNNAGFTVYPTVRVANDSAGPIAAQGQTFTGSAYVKFIAGTNPGIRLSVRENTSTGTYINEGTIITPNSVLNDNQFVTVSKTMASASTGRTNLYFYCVVPNTQSIDVTFRIAAPQLELSPVATEYIPTSGTAASAGAGTLESKTAIFSTTRTETGTATEQGSSSNSSVNSLTDSANATESASNIITTNQTITETAIRTNYIRNNTMVGASTSPSTYPTNWGISYYLNNMTADIVGVGQENGIDYVDIKFVGTSAGANPSINLLLNNVSFAVSAVQGQTFTISSFVKRVSGTTTNLAYGRLGYFENNSSDSYITGMTGTNRLPTLTNTFTRYSDTLTVSNASTAYIKPIWNMAFSSTAGVAIDITLRFGWPQLELNSVATQVIPTSGTVGTAGAGNTETNIVSFTSSTAEPAQRTNYVSNNTMVGAVAGTPGTLPTNWVHADPVHGLSRQIVATGTSNGISYIDVRISGTANTSSGHAMYFEGITTASVGQTWTSSVYLALIAGTMPNAIRVGIEEAVGTTRVQATWFNTSPTPSNLTRFSSTRTFTDVTTNSARASIDYTYTSGNTYDFTIRIGLPQLELSPVATEVIPTSGTVGTAGAGVTESNVTTFVSSISEAAQRTNYVPNSTYEGFATGTPGTIPTSQPWFKPTGSTITYVAKGVDPTTGFTYVDISINYTNSSGTLQSIGFDPVSATVVPASQGQTWISSGYFALLAGSWPTSPVSIGTVSRTSGGGGNGSAYYTLKSLGSTLSRVSGSLTMGANTAYAQTAIRIDVANGDSVNFTFRMAAPQLELGTVATQHIPTSGVAASAGVGVTESNATSFQSNITQTTRRTNFVTNSVASGAAAGNPGTAPTGWSFTNYAAQGVTTNIVATGTDVVTGLPYVDFRVFGTSTSSVLYNGVNPLAGFTSWPLANVGDSFTTSFYVALISGSLPRANIQVREIDASQNYLTATLTQLAGQLTTSLKRFSVSRTMSNALVARAQMWIEFQTLLTDGAVDFTLRIAAPQLEKSSVMSEYVPTTGTAIVNDTLDSQNNIITTNQTITETAAAVSTESNITTFISSINEAAQRTNYIVNNTMVGAVAGTPGTPPTTWSSNDNSLMSREIVGTGVEDGINYIDVRFFGTTTADTSRESFVFPNATIQQSASINQTWTHSAYVKMVAGSLTGITSGEIFIIGYNSSNSITEASPTVFNYSLTAGSLKQNRVSKTLTLTSASTVYIKPRIDVNLLPSTAYDFTVRVGMPQLELSPIATEVIPTSGTIASAGPASKESNVTSFVSSINEAGTAGVTESNVTAFASSIGEAGTAGVTESNVTAFVSSISETAQRTNYVLNTSMQGAAVGVIGSGGSLPTGWVWVFYSWATREVTGLGTNSYGESYIELRLSGTNNSGSTSNIDIYPVPTTQNVAAAVGDEFNASMRVEYVAGSTSSGFTGPNRSLTIAERSSSDTYLTGNGTPTINKNGGFSTVSRTISNASVAKAVVYLEMSVPNGNTVDVTLRISIPQFERGSRATEFIPSAGTPGTAGSGTRETNLTSFVSSINEAAQRTNYVRNNTMVGAAVGIPGTQPTYWTSSTTIDGLTRQIYAVGTINGINYVDIRWSGTSSTAGNVTILTCENNAFVGASNGQTWTASAYLSLVGGTLSNINSINLSVRYNNSTGSILTSQNLPVTLTSSLSRFSTTLTATDALTAYVNQSIVANFVDNTSVDFILRVALPQLELGSFATEVIPTSGTIASAGPSVIESNVATFMSSIGEAGTAGVTESNSTSFASSISEAGTAGDIESNITSFVSSINEAAQRTNYVRNNTMVGVNPGTNTPPTNWNIYTAGGLTQEITGTGIENGINYIDIRYSGTTNAAVSNLIICSPESSSVVIAAVNETWTSSFYVKIAAGSLSGLTSVVMTVDERTSGGTLLSNAPTYNITSILGTGALNTQRIFLTRTLNQATVARVGTTLRINVPISTAIDVTFRVGMPQLELAPVATEVIPTSGSFGTAGASSGEKTTAIFVSSTSEPVEAVDTTFNVATRVASIVEQIFSIEINSSQVSFVSSLIEFINAQESNINNLFATSNVLEIISSQENHNAFVNFVTDALEILSLSEDVRGGTGTDVQTVESNVVSDLASSTVIWPRYVSELITAIDSATVTALYQSLVQEFGLTVDIVNSWLILALDYDIVAAQQAHMEVEYDHIYVDDLEVVYGVAPQAYMEIEYGYIYVDDLEVVYGNLVSAEVDASDQADFRFVA